MEEPRWGAVGKVSFLGGEDGWENDMLGDVVVCRELLYSRVGRRREGKAGRGEGEDWKEEWTVKGKSRRGRRGSEDGAKRYAQYLYRGKKSQQRSETEKEEKRTHQAEEDPPPPPP